MDENAQSTTSTGIQDYYNLIKAEHEANNAWSAEQAQKAMDYQTQMSNTAHQREVADLKAAGLNPVLSAGGSGATSGSGIAAQRGDENVTALYGLTKMALDASIQSSKAMNNIAHYVSGASGYSSGFSTGSDMGDSILDIIADRLYRRYGIKQEHTKQAVESVIGFFDDVGYTLQEMVKSSDPVLYNFVKKAEESAYSDNSPYPGGSKFAGFNWSNIAYQGQKDYLSSRWDQERPPDAVSGAAPKLNSTKKSVKSAFSSLLSKSKSKIMSARDNARYGFTIRTRSWY